MDREVPEIQRGTGAQEVTIPPVFDELAERMLHQQMRSQLVVPTICALIEESATRYWRLVWTGETMEPLGRTVFRRTYLCQRTGQPPTYVLIAARKEDDNVATQSKDLRIAQCYFWDGERWKFAFEWDHSRDDWAFDQSPLSVTDPLDAGSSNYNPSADPLV
jgi:hypothetical protein